MKTARRLFSAAGAAVLATALLTPLTAGARTGEGSALEWTPCPPGSGVSATAECAEFDVPRDYADPDAGSLTITMSRIPATGTADEYRGVLAGNPGGPGGSALGMFADAQDVADGTTAGKAVLPEQTLRQYDLVAVQPRGHAWAGDMDCAVDDVPAILLSPLGAGAIHRACETAEPGLVGTITTDNTARDLNMARQALGQEKLNLYGLSYGGPLMSTYATLFPQHTDRMILDSSVAPSDRWFNLGASRLDDRRAALHAYFSWIAERDDEYGLGTTPLQVYQSWSHRVHQEIGRPAEIAPPPAQLGDLPAEITRHAELAQAAVPVANQVLQPLWRANSAWNAVTSGQPGATAGSPMFVLTVYGALYDESSWPEMAAWIRDGVPAEALEASFDDDAELEGVVRQQLAAPMVELSIICNENASPVHHDRVVPQIVDSWTGGDTIGVIENNIATGQVCAGWPLPQPARDLSGAGLEHAPLLLGYSRDNAVTGEAIDEVQAVMGGEKIVLDGWSHGVLINDADTVADEVAAYLGA